MNEKFSAWPALNDEALARAAGVAHRHRLQPSDLFAGDTLQAKLSSQQQGVKRRQQELQDLKNELATQEAEYYRKTRETGARSQRVNVSTLKGAPEVEQVGTEMANAIRKRQQRRSDSSGTAASRHRWLNGSSTERQRARMSPGRPPCLRSTSTRRATSRQPLLVSAGSPT